MPIYSRGHRRSRGRHGKREAIDDAYETFGDDNEVPDSGVEHELSVLNLLEPDQCFHRLICDLSTGRMPQSPIDFIATMFTGENVG